MRDITWYLLSILICTCCCRLRGRLFMKTINFWSLSWMVSYLLLSFWKRWVWNWSLSCMELWAWQGCHWKLTNHLTIKLTSLGFRDSISHFTIGTLSIAHHLKSALTGLRLHFTFRHIFTSYSCNSFFNSFIFVACTGLGWKLFLCKLLRRLWESCCNISIRIRVQSLGHFLLRQLSVSTWVAERLIDLSCYFSFHVFWGGAKIR